MRNLRCGLAVAASWMFLASGPAAGQSVVVGESGDPGFLNSLPTPVVADVFTGPLVGQFPNARLTGSAIGLQTGEVEIVDNVALPFVLQVFPPDAAGAALVRFTVAGEVVEKTVPAPLSDTVYDANALFVVATSGGPGMIVQASGLLLEVPTGRGGGIASIAEADGLGTEFSVVSLGCVSYELGFKLSGNITFAGTEQAPITDFPGSVQIRLSEASEDCESDSDFDGVPNDFPDNCPVTANPGQEDFDGDSKGDVCDECPEDPRPSDDLDGDEVGFLCDNCPLGCLLQEGNANCKNGDQTNSDDDRFGDICDNCFDVTNEPVCCAEVDPTNPRKCVPFLPEIPCDGDDDCSMGPGRCLQADSDGDGEGDACTASGLTATAVPVVPDPNPLFALTPVTSAVGDSAFELSVLCGVRSLSAANVPFRIPTFVSAVDFGTCQTDVGPPNEQKKSCSACTTPGPLDSGGCGLGASVNPAESFTRGRMITNPAVGSDLFVISLVGNETEGGESNRLCLATDTSPRFLGTLTLTGLDPTDPNQPSIVSESLNFFTNDEQARCEPAGDAGEGPEPGDPLCTLLSTVDTGQDPVPVPTNLTTTSVLTDSGVTVEVRPAVGEETGIGERIERFQVTVTSADSIDRIAVAFQGFQGMVQGDALFGGCDIPITIDPPPDGMGDPPPYQIFGCRDFLDPMDPNLDLGPRVFGGTFGDGVIPFSYVVYPGTPNAPMPPDVAPDSVYVVFTATSASGINDPNLPALLGVFEYQPGGPATLPQPVVLTEGVQAFFDPLDDTLNLRIQEAVVFSDPTVDPETNVSSVGGVGSTSNRDTDSLADENDNCVAVANQAQLDDGRFLAFSPDGIGNVCQCGNSNDIFPGSIFSQDLDECTEALGTGTTAPQNIRRCSVSSTQDDGQVDIQDLATLDLALNVQGVCREEDDPSPNPSDAGVIACSTDAQCPSPQRCFDKVRVAQGCEQAGQ